ncbi:expressed unknown protein [Seminavis robusta]|uniref:Uncharacterized protein n=1 Tax=Seminavis robusta TaxID=568900 RepID=A0A9N8DXK9_9STRA|nr:expressed unknown protein [Seminavis robusta]|eukprot:Sro348_g123320.1 n/a (540) ;mRNA; r:65338-67369
MASNGDKMASNDDKRRSLPVRRSLLDGFLDELVAVSSPKPSEGLEVKTSKRDKAKTEANAASKPNEKKAPKPAKKNPTPPNKNKSIVSVTIKEDANPKKKRTRQEGRRIQTIQSLPASDFATAISQKPLKRRKVKASVKDKAKRSEKAPKREKVDAPKRDNPKASKRDKKKNNKSIVSATNNQQETANASEPKPVKKKPTPAKNNNKSIVSATINQQPAEALGMALPIPDEPTRASPQPVVESAPVLVSGDNPVVPDDPTRPVQPGAPPANGPSVQAGSAGSATFDGLCAHGDGNMDDLKSLPPIRLHPASVVAPTSIPHRGSMAEDEEPAPVRFRSTRQMLRLDIDYEPPYNNGSDSDDHYRGAYQPQRPEPEVFDYDIVRQERKGSPKRRRRCSSERSIERSIERSTQRKKENEAQTNQAPLPKRRRQTPSESSANHQANGPTAGIMKMTSTQATKKPPHKTTENQTQATLEGRVSFKRKPTPGPASLDEDNADDERKQKAKETPIGPHSGGSDDEEAPNGRVGIRRGTPIDPHSCG